MLEFVGMKQVADTTLNFDWLIDFEDEQKLKDFFQQLGLVVVSIQEFSGKEEEFGKYSFVVDTFGELKKNLIIIPSKKDGISAGFELLISGLKIVSVDLLQDFLSQKEGEKIITKSQKKVEYFLSQLNQEKKSKKIVFSHKDKKLKKIKDLGEKILDFIKIPQEIEKFIPKNELKQLEFLQNDLKKYVRGNNFQKIKQTELDVLGKFEEIIKNFGEMEGLQQELNNLAFDIEVFKYDSLNKIYFYVSRVKFFDSIFKGFYYFFLKVKNFFEFVKFDFKYLDIKKILFLSVENFVILWGILVVLILFFAKVYKSYNNFSKYDIFVKNLSFYCLVFLNFGLFFFVFKNIFKKIGFLEKKFYLSFVLVLFFSIFGTSLLVLNIIAH